jgi:hypothetical protein
MTTNTTVTTVTTEESREESMARMYGEVCSKAQAARILGCSPATIALMIDDGRLEDACEGRKVDVRSIARYIQRPREMDFEARQRKMMLRNGSDWAV